MKKVRIIFLFLISMYGVFSSLEGLTEFIYSDQKWQSLIIAVCFAVVSPWFVKLPSGSSWRPSICFVLLSMLMFHANLALFTVTPGLLFITWKSKAKWWDYPLTIGHISLGILVGKQVLLLCSPASFSLPMSLLGMAVSLAAHLLVNRFISVVIVTTKKNKRFKDQLGLALKELHWGYLTTYLMSMLIYMQMRAYDVWGLAVCVIFLTGIYESFVYYNRMRYFQQSAVTDGLTSCENRRAFDTFIQEVKRTDQPGILIMIDLDRFKDLNDECGHLTGDEVLRHFAKKILQGLRNGDRLFRYGGDEFILYVRNESDLPIGYLRTIKELDQLWEEKGFPVRVSYGQASYPREATNWQQIIHIADERMYEFKRKQKLRTADL